MQRFEKGDLVLTSYYMPRSGGARPTVMLVVGSWPVGSHGFDYWLCAVTLDPADDPYEIPLNVADMQSGSISETFWIHPTYTGAVA